MVDLHFAEAKDKKLHDCSICPELQKRTRKCGLEGFYNASSAKFRVDDKGLKYTFCPGKATWYPSIVKTFQQCLFAQQTGILPKDAHFQNQDELFVEVYPDFVQHYTERKYGRVWGDVNKFTEQVFKAISKMFGGK